METNQNETQEIVGRIQEMSLPQLRMLKDHIEHEIELALKEAEEIDLIRRARKLVPGTRCTRCGVETYQDSGICLTCQDLEVEISGGK